MAETTINSDAGRKRRLPSWMLGQCSSNKELKNEDNMATCLLMEKKCSQQGEPDADCITRKLATDKQEACRTGDSRVSGLKNNGRLNKSSKDSVSVQQKKSPKYRSKKGKLEFTSQRSENEIELTVEDLINIAKEYVNADREQHAKTSSATGDCKGETYQSKSSIPSDTDPRAPPESVGYFGYELSSCSSVRSNKYSDGVAKVVPASENVSDRKDKFIHQSETILLNDIKKSGDAAQDMLNLFLGPLLLKTSSVDQDR